MARLEQVFNHSFSNTSLAGMRSGKGANPVHSELRFQKANVVRRAINLPERVAIELQEDIAVGTESLRVPRDPEVRPIQQSRPRHVRLRGQDEPLVEVSVRTGQVVAKPGEPSVPDAAAFQTPRWE